MPLRWRETNKKLSRFLKREYGFSREGVQNQRADTPACPYKALVAIENKFSLIRNFDFVEPAHARHSKNKFFLCARLLAALSLCSLLFALCSILYSLFFPLLFFHFFSYFLVCLRIYLHICELNYVFYARVCALTCWHSMGWVINPCCGTFFERLFFVFFKILCYEEKFISNLRVIARFIGGC